MRSILLLFIITLLGCNSTEHIKKGDDIVHTIATNVQNLALKLAEKDPEFTEAYIEAKFAAKRAAAHAKEDPTHPLFKGAKAVAGGLYNTLGPIGTTAGGGGILGLAFAGMAMYRKIKTVKDIAKDVGDMDPEQAKKHLREKRIT